MGPVRLGTSVDFRVADRRQSARHCARLSTWTFRAMAHSPSSGSHQLIRQPLPVAERRFEIEFASAGAAATASPSAEVVFGALL